MIEPNLYAQQGWQCPICKRIYSPLTPMCFYCKGGSNSWTDTSTSSGTYPVDHPISDTVTTPYEPSLDCWQNSPILLTSNPPKLEWKCRFCGRVITTEVTEMPSKPCECLSSKSKGE